MHRSATLSNDEHFVARLHASEVVVIGHATRGLWSDLFSRATL